MMWGTLRGWSRKSKSPEVGVQMEAWTSRQEERNEAVA